MKNFKWLLATSIIASIIITYLITIVVVNKIKNTGDPSISQESTSVAVNDISETATTIIETVYTTPVAETTNAQTDKTEFLIMSSEATPESKEKFTYIELKTRYQIITKDDGLGANIRNDNYLDANVLISDPGGNIYTVYAEAYNSKNELSWYVIGWEPRWVGDITTGYIKCTRADIVTPKKTTYILCDVVKFIVPPEWEDVDIEEFPDKLVFYYKNVCIGSFEIFPQGQTGGDIGGGILTSWELPVSISENRKHFGFCFNNVARSYENYLVYGNNPILDKYGNAITDTNIIDAIIYFQTNLHISDIYNYDEYDSATINKYIRTVTDYVYILYQGKEFVPTEQFPNKYSSLTYEPKQAITVENTNCYYDVAHNLLLGSIPINTLVYIYGYKQICEYVEYEMADGWVIKHYPIFTKIYYTNYGHIYEDDLKIIEGDN